MVVDAAGLEISRQRRGLGARLCLSLSLSWRLAGGGGAVPSSDELTKSGPRSTAARDPFATSALPTAPSKMRLLVTALRASLEVVTASLASERLSDLATR